MEQGLWSRIKLWTRLIFLFAVLGHIILLLWLNYSATVKLSLIYASFEEAHLLVVLVATCVISIFAWWLVTSMIRVSRRLREGRMAQRLEKLERERDEAMAKSARLKTADDK